MMRQKKRINLVNDYIDQLIKGKKPETPAGLEEVQVAKKLYRVKIKASQEVRERVWLNIRGKLIAKKPSFSSLITSWLSLAKESFYYLKARSLATRFLAAFIAFIIGTGSLNYAAAQSLPGSPLYPGKRAFEKITLVLSLNPVSKANKYLDQTETRLDEAKIIWKEKTKDSSKTVKTLIAEINKDLVEVRKLLKEIPPGKARMQIVIRLENFNQRFDAFKKSLELKAEPAKVQPNSSSSQPKEVYEKELYEKDDSSDLDNETEIEEEQKVKEKEEELAEEENDVEQNESESSDWVEEEDDDESDESSSDEELTSEEDEPEDD